MPRATGGVQAQFTSSITLAPGAAAWAVSTASRVTSCSLMWR